jgi:polysaccharide biosynthesis protein PslE
VVRQELILSDGRPPAAYDLSAGNAYPSVPSGNLLRSVVHVLFKRKWLILSFFLIVTATASVALVKLNKTAYQASAQIVVAPGRENVADLTLPTSGAVTPRFSFVLDEQIARAAELITSRYLAERVVREIGPTALYPDLLQPSPFATLGGFLAAKPMTEDVLLEAAVARYQEMLSVEAGKSAFLTISFRHPNPEMAARVVNLLCDKYIDRHLSVTKNPESKAFFEQQFEQLKKKVAESEARFRDFKIRYGITGTIHDEEDNVAKQAAALRAGVIDARSLAAESQSRAAQLKGQLANTARNSSVITALQEKLTALELEESAMALRYTAANPSLIALRDQIKGLRASLREAEGNKSYGTTARDGSLYGRLQEDALRAEAERSAHAAREASQNGKLNELTGRLASLNAVETEYNHLEQQLALDQQNFKLYQTKFEESRINEAMDAERIASVRITDKAKVPINPVNAKLPLKMALGAAFGLFGGIALAFLLQVLGGRLETAEDVERVLNLPVLASIPRLRV